MILLLAKTDEFNAIHLILGKESDVQQALQGSCISDITDLVKRMDKEKPIRVIVTRAQDEHQVARELQRRGLPGTDKLGSCDCPECSSGGKRKNEENSLVPLLPAGKPNQRSTAKLVPPTDLKNEPITHLKQGTCEYCRCETGLLPVPQVKICVTCTHIELMRHKEMDDAGAE